MLPADDLSDGLLCHVDNQRPDLVYQPAVQQHPNAAVAVTGVIVNSSDGTAAIQRWERALGGLVSRHGRFELDNAVIELRDLSASRPALPRGLAGLSVRVPALPSVQSSLSNSGCVVVEETSATLTLRLPPPANALLVFHI